MRVPRLAVFVLSAAALAYEIALMRAFSVVQWHHFAYMIISVALLGYGISGSALALAPEWWRRRYPVAFLAGACVFAVTAGGCFALAQRVPFNALELLWDPGQPAWLFAIYGLLLVPFLAAAACVCLTFMAFPQRVGTVYAADLLGAGAGAFGVVALFWLLPPAGALRWIALAGVLAAALALAELALRWRALVAVVLTAVLVFVLPFTLVPSPYKALSRALEVQGAELIDERAGPLGQLSTVASPTVPFRHAPGLSLAATASPPEQLAVFSDGGGPTVIDRADEGPEGLAYLDFLGSAVAYALVEAPSVLVLGAGTGVEVNQALRQGARRVDAVELNPQLVALVQERFGSFSGRPFARPGVVLHVDEARGFVAGAAGHWDVIQLSLLESFGAASAGLHALSEGYLYTVEALAAYRARLAPGGVLAITRWLKVPPRDGIKLFATANRALRAADVRAPGAHLALLRTWNTTTLLVGRDPLAASQIEALRAFAAARWFDLAWYPGMDRAEANRHNQLQEPWLHDAARRLLAGDEGFFEEYKFQVRPATDDRPHFSRFLRLGSVPELWSLRERGGLPLLEQGYLVLLATLLQVVLASLLLVLVPLWLLGRRRAASAGLRVLGYFLAIGLGFMLVEIAWIQKFGLFLSHPLYAVTVVLASFLVFAGLGSLASAPLAARLGPRRLLLAAIAAIVLLALAYRLGLPPLLALAMALPEPVRITLSVGLIAPLAFVLGLPFPLGLAALPSALAPRAWAVNGAASVIGAVAATLLGIHLGFGTSVVAGAGCYLLAAVLGPAFVTATASGGTAAPGRRRSGA